MGLKPKRFHVQVMVDGIWHTITSTPVTMPTALSLVETRKRNKLKTEQVRYEAVQDVKPDAK